MMAYGIALARLLVALICDGVTGPSTLPKGNRWFSVRKPEE